MFNKDLVAPGRMRRRIEKPRILLLDCPLEYKKGARGLGAGCLACGVVVCVINACATSDPV